MLNVVSMAIILKENPSNIKQKLYGYNRNDISYEGTLPAGFEIYMYDTESLISNLEIALKIIAEIISNNELPPEADLWLKRLIAIFLSASRTPTEFMLAEYYPYRSNSIPDTFANYAGLLQELTRDPRNIDKAEILSTLLGVYYDRQSLLEEFK
ncbi:MAG: hypothetical protein KatS3mg091_407 [Patescibacteria group bacterium]|nr:MAG: hypothetical protein KatS3mg091_407 [Patescibacteria group bacterium]